MKELICVNIGQAGVQISNAIWELMCLEHGISTNGNSTLSELSAHSPSPESIFMEVSHNKFVPRTISIDLEPTVIDEIRTGTYRDLFGPSQLISGLEDSSCNFARGHYTIGKSYLEEFMDILRHLANLCNSIQGFMIVQSFGGGCGSGFASLVMEQLSIEYSKRSKMQFSILPSSHLSCAIVEPYNVVLSGKTCLDTTDLCLQHDNQSIFKVVQNKLEINSPTFNNINRLLAQVFSSLTVSMRYENALNNDLDQIATNLIPYPRLHYPLDIYSPICCHKTGAHYLHSTNQITKDVFNFENKLLDCNFDGEKFLSCCLQYRGNVYPSEVNKAVLDIKKNESIKFVDWCPTGYKIGINRHPTIAPKESHLYDTERSLLLLCNNTCIHQKLGNLNSKFDILFSKRSFVHWFVGEGMEESEFIEARDEFAYLEEDYKCLTVIEETFEVRKTINPVQVKRNISENVEQPFKNNEIYEYIEEQEKSVNDQKKSDSSDYSHKKSVSKNSEPTPSQTTKHSVHAGSKKSSRTSTKKEDKLSIPGKKKSDKSSDNENETERNERLNNFVKENESTQSDISTL